MRKAYIMSAADRGEQFGNTIVTDATGILTDKSYAAELITPNVVMVHWRMRAGNTRAETATRSQMMYSAAMDSLNVRLKEQVSGRRTYNAGEIAVALEAGNTCALVVKTLKAMKMAIQDSRAGGVKAYGSANFIAFLERINNWLPVFESRLSDLPIIPNFKRYLDLLGYKHDVKMGISVVSVCDEIYFRGATYQLETSWEANVNASNLERDLLALYNALTLPSTDTTNTTQIQQAASDLLSTDKSTHFKCDDKVDLDYNHMRDNLLNSFAFYATKDVAARTNGFWEFTRAGSNYHSYLAARLDDLNTVNMIQQYYVDRGKTELPFDKCLGTPKGRYGLSENNEGISGYVSSWCAVAQFTVFNYSGTNYDYGTYWLYSINDNGAIVNSGQPNRVIPLLSMLGLLPAINAVGVAGAGVENELTDVTANSVPLCPYDKDVINPSILAIDDQLGVEHERWLVESFDILDERYQHGRKDNRKKESNDKDKRKTEKRESSNDYPPANK